MHQQAQQSAACSGANLPTLRRNALHITLGYDVNICHATRRHKPDECNMHGHRCANLRSVSMCATGCHNILFYHGQSGHLGARRVLHIVFWWEILRKRDHLDDLGVGGKIILE